MKIAALVTTLLLGTATAAMAEPAYKVATALPLGAPDRWDYVVFDAGLQRVFVAHADRVTVVDPAAGKVVATIDGIAGGTHGVAISAATGQGFTDDGRNGKAVAFDLKTLKVTRTLPADDDADAVAIDRATGHVFFISGDPGTITVVDPAKKAVVATIKAGEKMEYGVTDDAGTLFVAGEANGDLIKIDARTNAVVAHWPAPGCTSPHGLAIDKVANRLFMGCANAVMMVMDGSDGRVIATLPIGRGNDAVAYDPVRHRVFSSNGLDGTISVFRQGPNDDFTALDPITTAVSGRTMSLDPDSGRLFVAAADTDPAATPGGRPQVRPGTLKLLILDPVQ